MKKERLQELAGINENVDNMIQASNKEGKEYAAQMIKTAQRLSTTNPEWVIDIMLDRMKEVFEAKNIKSASRIKV